MWDIRVLVGRTERKSLLGKRGYRWENNIKIVHKGVGLEGVDWIDLVQDKTSCRLL